MGYKNVVLFRWSDYSRGARNIANELGIRIIRNKGTHLVVDKDMYAINWGSSNHPLFDEFRKDRVLNHPTLILTAADKLSFFKTMAKAPDPPRIPDWTQNAIEAVKWFEKGEEVCARLTLRGHSGTGLEFFSDHRDDLDPLFKARLFTKYVKKKDEYRVHVFKGEIIDIQKKLLKKTDDLGNKVDPKTVDFRIRNLAAGFVYGGRDGDVPKDVERQAMKAMAASGLDFGAVDVLYNEKEDKAYVLEINTAPGLMGTTLSNYINAFHKFLQAQGIAQTSSKTLKEAL